MAFEKHGDAEVTAVVGKKTQLTCAMCNKMYEDCTPHTCSFDNDDAVSEKKKDEE